MKKTQLLLLYLFLFPVALTAQSLFVPATHKKITYEGRINFTEEAAALYWPGSSVTVRFKGTGASAFLRDTRNANYFLVIVDGNVDSAKRIKLDTAKKLFVLAQSLPYDEHTITLFKLTDASTASLFYGFEVDHNTSLLKPPVKPKRKIEFYGNSITAGHGVDVPLDSADNGKPQFFNNYLTYAAITARHFNAQYHCIAKSGIGVTVSWFPEIMPEVYNRVAPFDSTSRWNFKNYQPDIVVVNLFQNDSWIVNQPTNEQFRRRFGTTKPSEEFLIKAYADFIRKLRGVHPKAKIICCLGNMDITREGSKWPGYVSKAVTSLNDKNIVTHFFTYKNTPGHPKVPEQKAMADDLIKFIESNYWKVD